jgi:hypothetical protein
MRLWAVVAGCLLGAASARVQWAGAVADTSVVIVVERFASDGAGQLLLSRENDLSNPVQTLAPVGTGIIKWPVTGLTPDTRYFYGILGACSVASVDWTVWRGCRAAFPACRLRHVRGVRGGCCGG